jgi:hypothetical protein
MGNRHERRAATAVERRQGGRPAIGHVAVVTPAYASTAPEFAQSLAATFVELNAAGFAVTPVEAHGGSHIDLVRDMLTIGALVSGAELSLWIDVDQSWTARDALKLVLATKDSVDFAGLPVPCKTIDWGAVGRAARSGAPDERLLEAGCASWTTTLRAEDVSPEGYVGPVRNVATPFGAVRLVRAKRVPTAFACIRRSVFERVIEANPAGDFTRGGQPLNHLFSSGIGKSGWRGEDEAFTEACDALGIECWVWPDAVVGHHGPFEFRSAVDLNAWARRTAG